MIIVYFTLLHVQFKDWHIELKQFNVSMTTSNLTFERKGLRLLLLSTRYYKNIGSRNINILSFIYIRYQTINKRMKKFSATYRWYNKDDMIKVWFKIFLFFFQTLSREGKMLKRWGASGTTFSSPRWEDFTPCGLPLTPTGCWTLLRASCEIPIESHRESNFYLRSIDKY